MEQIPTVVDRRSEFDDYGEMEVFAILHTMRRRWWMVALGGLLVGAIYAGYALWTPPMYTAEAVIQRQRAPSGMESLTFNLYPNQTPEMVNDQLNIIRSYPVLSEAVDSLGLRVRVLGRALKRTELIGEVEVEPTAGGLVGEARVALERRDGSVALVDIRTQEVLSVRDPQGWVSGPGYRFQVLSPELVTVDEPILLEILLPREAADRFRSLLQANQIRGTTLLELVVTSPDPEFSARSVNAVAGAYQSFAGARAQEVQIRSREFVELELAKMTDSLNAARAELVTYQDTAQTWNPELESDIVASTLMQRQIDFRLVEFEEEVLIDLVEALDQDADESLLGILAVGRGMVPGIEVTYVRLQDLYQERSRLTTGQFGFTAQSSEVEVLDSLISETKIDIQGMVAQSLALATSRRISEAEELEVLEARLGELPGQTSTYGSLIEEIEAIKSIYDLLIANYYEARILQQLDRGDVVVMTYATVPLRADDPNTIRNLIIAIIAGLAFGAGVVVVIESLDTKVRDIKQAQAMVATDVMGVIPKQLSAKQLRKSNRGRSKDGAGKGSNAFDEAFGGLRTSIRYSASLDPDKTSIVLVTSPAPSEGKTTVATNLALTLSRQDMNVLLIDADLRRPSVHKVFKLPNEEGLGDYLRQRNEVLELPHKSRITKDDLFGPDSNIDVITAGTHISNPSEVLGGKRLKAMIEEARGKYDAIIVDTPPVLAVTDTLLISEVCDAVLLVGRINQTDRFSLRRAMDELNRVDTPVLGLVVNDMGPRDGYSAYYGSGYYGNYEGY